MTLRTRLVLLTVLLTGLAAGAGWLAWRDETPAIAPTGDDASAIRVLGGIVPMSVPTQAPPAQRPAAPQAPPHVVLIITCTVRRDQIGLYGGPDTTTPFLDQLGADGVVFDDPISATPWTKPAVTAILTGRHALGLGLADPSPGRNDRQLPDAAVTLAERLHDAGWLTLGASANPNITPTFGFDQGFDGYQLGLDADWSDKIAGTRLAAALLQALDDRRAQGDARPAFLQAVVFDTHARRNARPDEVRPFEEAGLPERVARYRAHLKRIDTAIATMHDGLAARGMADDTLFIVMGDHGEGMSWPTHHGPRHGLFFGSSATHIPWVMAGAGLPRGRRVPGPVSQVDLVPTVLSLLGQPVPAGLDGRDLAGVVTTDGAVVPDEPVFSDTWFADGNRVAMFTRQRTCQLDLGGDSSVRTAEDVPFPDGCWDRHRDPLGFQVRDPRDGWRDALLRWREHQQQRANGQAAGDVTVSDDLAASLAALGYVEAGEDDPTDTDRR